MEFEDLKNLWLSSTDMLKEVGEFRLEQHQKEYLKRFIVYEWNRLLELMYEPRYAPTSPSYSPLPPSYSASSPGPSSPGPSSPPPSSYSPSSLGPLGPSSLSPPQPHLCHQQHRCLYGIQSFLRAFYYDKVFLTFNNLHLMFEHEDNDDLNIRYFDHLLTMW